MKKLMISSTVILGVIFGLTCLTANAEGEITYGNWYFQSSKGSMIGWDMQYQCTYSRTRWKAGYGSLQNEYYVIYFLNKSCPSVSQVSLPK